jgi:hypothetical protein
MTKLNVSRSYLSYPGMGTDEALYWIGGATRPWSLWRRTSAVALANDGHRTIGEDSRSPPGIGLVERHVHFY